MLHYTLKICTLVGNSFLEATFFSIEDIQHTFNITVIYKGKKVSFIL